MLPQNVLAFQLEHAEDMCAIISIVQSPTNPAEANFTSYIVLVDGETAPCRTGSFTSADGRRHYTIYIYESSCGAHRISISANNMCGQSPGTVGIMLDPEQHLMLNMIVPNSASNIECKFYVSSSKYQ